MAGQFQWFGDQALAWIKADIKRRLTLCAILVADHAKALVSGDGTAAAGSRKRRVRDAKGRLRRSRKLVYHANPSAPGEPPNVQTGQLRGSIAWEVAGLAARIGSNLKKARWLELGTKRMAARPFLRRALRECRAAILAILSAPMKGP